MIDCAQKIIVLADSSKFRKRGFGRICELESIDHIITDDNLSLFIRQKLNDMGIEVTLVKQSKDN
jgi:DeoR family transcriptional regulator of aga operon